jgi:hypothetical protein
MASLRAREAHRGRREQEIDRPALKRADEGAVRPLRDRRAGIAKEDMRGEVRVGDGGAHIAIGAKASTRCTTISRKPPRPATRARHSTSSRGGPIKKTPPLCPAFPTFACGCRRAAARQFLPRIRLLSPATPFLNPRPLACSGWCRRRRSATRRSLPFKTGRIRTGGRWPNDLARMSA